MAVDGAGAVYLAASYIQYSRHVIDAVYRLAPSASNWTSLGKPPDNGPSDSMVALHGLQRGGVFAGWTTAGMYPNGGGLPELARWTPDGWQSVITWWVKEWTYDLRPRVQPVSDTDVWFAFNDQVTMVLTRWKLGP